MDALTFPPEERVSTGYGEKRIGLAYCRIRYNYAETIEGQQCDVNTKQKCNARHESLNVTTKVSRNIEQGQD